MFSSSKSGLAWHSSHAFALQDRSGRKEENTLPHSAESLHGWLRELGQRYGGRLVALAIEGNRGAVIQALLEQRLLLGQVRVFRKHIALIEAQIQNRLCLP